MSFPEILSNLMASLGLPPAAHDALASKAGEWFQKAYPNGHPDGWYAAKQWRLQSEWEQGTVDFAPANGGGGARPRTGDVILFGSEIVRVHAWGQDFANLQGNLPNGKPTRHCVLGWENSTLVTNIPEKHLRAIMLLRDGYGAGVYSRDCNFASLKFGDAIYLHQLVRKFLKENP